jgi:WD40 repeat protein
MMTINAHLDYVTAVNFNRDSTLIVSCSLDGLMYVTNVFGLLNVLIIRRRLWNTTTGTCLKTLVENGNVIWYVNTLSFFYRPVSVVHWLLPSVKYLHIKNALTSLSVNTSSSHPIVNTSSLRRMTPLSGCGTTKHPAVSRPMLVTGTSCTAFPHAFRSRVGSG